MSLTSLKTAGTVFFPLSGTTSAGEVDLIGGGATGSAASTTSRWERNGRARVFVSASSSSLQCGDFAGNSLNDAVGCTIALQVKFDAASAGLVQGIIGKGNTPNKEWSLYRFSDNNIYWDVHSTSGSGGTSEVGTLSTITTGVDYLIVLVHDAAANKLRMSVNGSALSANEAAHTGGIYDSTGDLRIGIVSGGNFLDGSIRNVFFAKGYVATDADCVALYNGGNVLRFSEWDASVVAARATVSFSGDEGTATVAVPTKTTMVIPRPTKPPWAYAPSGSTYYVDPAGDNTAAGTALAPWRTIQRGVETAVADDLVYINAGSYIEYLAGFNAGTLGHPVIFSCAPGALGQVRITPATESYTANVHLPVISPSNYVTINGLNIEGYLGRAGAAATEKLSAVGVAFNDQGPGCVVSNCLIHHNTHCGVKCIDTDALEGGVSALGNVVFDNGSEATDHGFYLHGSNWTITGNVAFRNSGFAYQLYVQPDGMTVRYNVMFANVTGGIVMGGSNSVFEYNSGDSTGSFTYFHGFCTGNLVRYNIFGASGWDNSNGTPASNTDTLNDYYPLACDASVPPGAGDVNVDPLLVNATVGDLRLQAGSPVPQWGAYPVAVPGPVNANRGQGLRWRKLYRKHGRRTH